MEIEITCDGEKMKAVVDRAMDAIDQETRRLVATRASLSDLYGYPKGDLLIKTIFTKPAYTDKDIHMLRKKE